MKDGFVVYIWAYAIVQNGICEFERFSDTFRVKPFPPSAVYMRQGTGPALGQLMACRLFGAEPLHQQILIFKWSLRYKLQWNSNQNTILFIHENVFENSKMSSDIWRSFCLGINEITALVSRLVCYKSISKYSVLTSLFCLNQRL